ncbi:MAG: hypothetical protein HY537_00700 [Deltaproteobacteria bacterium]|nr:hypothetical protein [Deltaproteobacteria bacterium]
MFKIFESIGSVIAIAAIIQFVSDPKGALNDIARGPAPNLRTFSDKLMNAGPHQKRHRQKQVPIGFGGTK